MQSWGLTDPGCVRKQNQDSYRIEQLDRGNLLCIVCDAKSGNIASSLAVDVFVEEVRRCWKPVMEQDKVDQMLRSAVKLANFTVYDQSRQFEEFDGMGTTLVAVMVRGRKASTDDACIGMGTTLVGLILQGETLEVVNVGDSRAYHVGKGGIRQVTKDHSLVQMMVDRGDLTPEVAKSYPGKNFITRAIGTETTVLCDIFHLDVGKGDYLLLCSDGLSNLLDDQEILFEVVHGVYKQNCCKRLLNIAKNRGAPDNVTSVLIAI